MSMLGKTLAHYEITSQLGKGGMVEGYQAKNWRLGADGSFIPCPPLTRDI